MPSSERRHPPASDEIEISLFGPGVGECVVLHLGDGSWMVVDSCCAAPGQGPIALEYLSELKVDVGSAVRLVVVTHWHSDHIGGIGEVFSKSKNADLWCSAAVDIEHFYELVRLLRGADPGVDEFAKLFTELVQRLPAGSRNVDATPGWAVSGRPMLRLPAGTAQPTAEVTALSPSDVAIARAHVKIGEALERAKTDLQSRRLVEQSPNEAAIALWVRAGAFEVLLGSDLEESTSPKDGWRAIVADHAAAARPAARAFKVAHHGSKNADSPDVWQSMLVSGAHAALTPFRRQKLPRPKDLQRLRSRTAELYVTADPEGRKPPRRDAAVDRTIREVAKKRIVLGGRAGHVRFRAPLGGGACDVALFDGAYRVG